jgi:hypothetical protein
MGFQVNPNRLKIYELAESRVNKNRTELAAAYCVTEYHKKSRGSSKPG